MHNSFDKLFKQVAEMLHLVQDNSKKPIDDDEIPPIILEKLNNIRDQVEKFKNMGDDFVDEWNKSKIPLRKKMHFPMGELTLSKEDRLLIERANQLKAQVENASKKLAEASQAKEEEVSPKKVEKDAPKSEQKFGTKRRRKFKRFGSNDKWKPL